MKYDVSKLIGRDRELKGGAEFERESSSLYALYAGQSKNMTLGALEDSGQGDPEQKRPIQTKLLRRVVRTVAVMWSTPPTRMLSIDGVTLPPTDVQSFELAYELGQINSWLKLSDRYSSLLAQAVVRFTTNRRGRVQPRVYAPHLVHRDPDPTNADDMATDRAVAFRVTDAKDAADCEFHVFVQENEDEWVAWKLNGKGNLIGDEHALFKDGKVPYAGPSFVQVYDDLSEGRAWLPLDETRTAFSLGLNVLANEIAYLLKQEAHTPVAVSGLSSRKSLPKRWGPGEVWGFEDEGVEVQTFNLNPKLLESIGVSRHFLELFAGGEGLPADYFLSSRKYETGASGRLRMQDLEQRRFDKLEGAKLVERECFEIIRSIWNAHAEEWERDPIDEDARLKVELSRPYFPVDVEELQQALFNDLSIGAASMIDYFGERWGLQRTEAIARYHRVQEDREKYPARENAAAILVGRRKAGEEGSATRTSDDDEDAGVVPDGQSPNPNRAASNEAGSRIGAARRGVSA